MNRLDNLKKGALKERIKFLVGDVFVYGGAAALYKFMALFLTPILTRYLSPNEFGIMDSLSVIGSILGVIIILGLDSAIARFFYETDDLEERIKYVTTTLFIQNISSIILLLVGLFGGKTILVYYLNTSEYFDIYIIIIITTFFLVNLRFAQNLLKWTFQRNKYLITTLGPVILYFLIALGLLLYFNWGLHSIYYAQLISNIVFSLISVYYCRNYLNFSIDTTKINALLKFGLPLMIVALVPALIPSIDKYFIIKFVGFTGLAYYGIGYRVASLLQLPVMGIDTAIGPFFYAIYKEENANSTIDLIILGATIIYICFIVILMTFSRLLFDILAPPEYIIGIYAILPLIFSILLLTLSTSLSFGINLSNKTYFYTIGYIADLLVTFISLYILTPTYGIVGVSYGILLGKLVLVSTLTIFAYKVYPFRYNLLKIIIVLLIGFFSGFIIQSTFNEQQYITILAGVLVLIIDFILYWRFVFNETQRAYVQGYLNRTMKIK